MKKQIVILAEKKLDPIISKMAVLAIRYLHDQIVAVIDSTYAGKSVEEVLGFGGDIPIYSSLDEALQHQPNTLIIGVLPRGGTVPSEWYPLIIKAIQNRLNIVNGLQEFLSTIPEFSVLSKKYGTKIIDLKMNKEDGYIARGRAINFRSKIVLTLGTNHNAGKLVTTLELVKELQKRGKSADWLPTGQTGKMIKGKGTALEMVRGQYISGEIESATAKLDGNYEYIVVQGQGALHNTALAPVSMGLLQGTLPDAMVLCHRFTENGTNKDYLKSLIQIYENILSYVKPSKVAAISLNTYKLNDEKAVNAIQDLSKFLRLPVTDPIRFGAEGLTDALVSYFSTYKKVVH
jgi:uncharacterized NAD-dependent epimerase/dehydratase family protein